MKNTILYLVIFAVSTVFITTQSCTKADEPYKTQEPTLPTEMLDYATLSNLNTEYKSTLKSSRVESLTNAGATLGRVLFYDKKMSLNNSTACGTCHLQDKAFADGKELSNGFFNEKTLRNSPSLINLINSEKFFWDARSEKLSDMVLNPVQDHIEMGLEDLSDLEEKLAATSYYPALFEDAFGSSEVTKEKVADALTQFLMSMASTRSKFDAGQENNFANFSTVEARGMQLFEDVGCVNCHGGADFKLGMDESTNQLKSTDQANVGLDMVYKDQGIFGGVFKIPSLRNVELTGPYMHDGRFTSLEQVVDHYSDHTINHPNVDDRLKSDNPGSGSWGSSSGGSFLTLTHLNLSPADKAAIVSFLKTLTDNDLITDERFADPFSE